MSSQLPPQVNSANKSELTKELIREGIAAAQNRKRREACTLFWKAIEIDPHNVLAWLWLSSSVERIIDQIACLETVLQIDPHNSQAHDQLARLTGVSRTTPAITAETGQAVAPPSPSISQPIPTQAAAMEAAEQSVEQPPSPPSQPISAPEDVMGTEEQVTEPTSPPVSQTMPTPTVGATQVEAMEETTPLLESQPEQGFDLHETVQASKDIATQAPDLVGWVVRPPVGEQTLILSSSEEKILDPHSLRRKQDYQLVMAKFDQSPYIRVISTEGNPPEHYRLEYRVKGLTEDGGRISERDIHTVEISLLMDYPRIRPVCRMLTPVFHPNIDVDGTICIGDHWAAGELLTSIMIQIAQILTYQSYNIRSPRNAQAARWASENTDDLPLQRTDFWE